MKDFVSQLDVITEDTYNQPVTPNNPRLTSVEEIKEVFLNALENRLTYC